MTKRLSLLTSLIGSLALASGAPARAADATPNPGIARISVIHGTVTIKRADSGDTVTAVVNAPLSIGDVLATGNSSQAEIEFDNLAAIRASDQTQLRFTDLSSTAHKLQLAQGTIELRVFGAPKGDTEVQTPQATITPNQSGAYRISVDANGNAVVVARSGSADVISQIGTRTADRSDAVAVSGTSTAPQFSAATVPPTDAFDTFNDQRDLYASQSDDAALDTTGVIGSDDLGTYGHWIETPEYGRVWSPNEPPGWAPYHDGRFSWEPYYGWTWIGAEPWGWAPYHYGSWFYGPSTGWCWYPGGYSEPFVYRPALVTFFSFGGGYNGGLASIGWSPIAPYEVYHPWYGGFGNYGFGQTTIVNNYVTNITNTTIVNSTAPGGAVVVDRAHFERGEFNNVHPLPKSRVAMIRPLTGVLPIVPNKRSLTFERSPSAIPSAIRLVSTAAFRSFAPPVALPPSFHSVQASVAKLESRPAMAAPLSHANVAPIAKPNVDVAAPSYRPTRSIPVLNGDGESAAWSRFHAPGASDTSLGAPASPRGAHTAPQPGPVFQDRGFERFPRTTSVPTYGHRPVGGGQFSEPRFDLPRSSSPRRSAPRMTSPQPVHVSVPRSISRPPRETIIRH